MRRLLLCYILIFAVSTGLIYGSEGGLWPFSPAHTQESRMPGLEKFPVFSMLLKFYHFYISPNDFSQCPFNPSCSMFMELSVKKFGVTGLLMGFDRLTRDNPWSEEGFYPKIKGHFLDPPEWHYLPFYRELHLEKVDLLLPPDK